MVLHILKKDVSSFQSLESKIQLKKTLIKLNLFHISKNISINLLARKVI